MNQLEENDVIDLGEIFFEIRKKIVAIILVIMVFTGGSIAITKFAMTPIYSSSSQLYVMSDMNIANLSNLTMGSQLTNDYMIVAKTRAVLEQIIKDLHLKMDYKELSDKITVENPEDTRIMQITATDPDPKVAQRIAQKTAEVTSKRVEEKMDIKAPTIIEDAYKAERPDSPSMPKNAAIGALLGAILAIGVVTFKVLTNDTIQKEEDIEAYLELNILAKLPLVEGETKQKKKIRKAR